MKRDQAAQQRAGSSPGKAPAPARSRTAQRARARAAESRCLAASRTPGQRAALFVVSILIFGVGVPVVKGLRAWEQLAAKGRPRPV